MDTLTLVGGILTGIAALLGGYAALKARQVEGRTATREETQQALNAQSELLNRYETRIEDQETLISSLRTKIDRALELQIKMAKAHQQCEASLEVEQNARKQLESRLRIAEARIAELGG